MTTALNSEPSPFVEEEGNSSLLDLMLPMAQSWKLLLILPLLVGLATLGVSYFVAPIFTARTSILPPQQPQSSAAATLASLGALSGIAGASTRTLSDQYAALLQSETVRDRIIEKFDLLNIYDAQMRVDARRILDQRVRVSANKKDGLLTIEVDDKSPERAANMANQYVQELRGLTSELALTEAQQRRAFFEAQLKDTRDQLAKAQAALEASGFNASALRTEPRAAVDGYARLQAEITGSEVRLQTLRRSLTDAAPEVQQQLSMLSALRQQLGAFAAGNDAAARGNGGADYISKYREFKYQETLFEVYSRQFELARLDESRDGALIQVIDIARPPERKSRPSRSVLAVSAWLISGFLLVCFLLLRHQWRQMVQDPAQAHKLQLLRFAMRGR